jgi:3-hydroxyisobutyrate dehydrogenase-like beta-hydroxyacid dehydrogenase
MSKSGFIGLGIMGDGMARRLLSEADSSLVVWNRSPEKSTKLQAEFPGRVEIVSTPKDVIAACDTTFLMLSTPEACTAVYTMPNGVLDGVSEGKKLVDSATLTPEDMINTSAEVKKKGGVFLEAPVSGSKVPFDLSTRLHFCPSNHGFSLSQTLSGPCRDRSTCFHVLRRPGLV